jgi:tetratricopeptide (TPR) repeat protein
MMNRLPCFRLVLGSCVLAIIAACGTTPRSPGAPRAARVHIEESVAGFTIFEDARIGTDVRSDYDRGLDQLRLGNIDEGIRLLEAVADSAPQLSAPRIDLGTAWHRLGDLEEAEKHLKLALEINPEHPIALNEIGIVYRKTARFAEARQSYEAALRVYPGFHFARRNLGVLCDLYLDDLPCALENYEAYMATVNSDDEAEMWLKNVRFRMGNTE